MNYYRALLKFDAEKLDYPKGIRQAILILLALLPFYYMGQLPAGLLVSLGTFAHIYVFSGTLTEKIKTVVVASMTLALAMMIGTLVSHNTILFGIFILIFTTVPYYVSNALSIKGPSSTFFLVVFGISSIMPLDPGAFLTRGSLVLLGGLLSIILVCLETIFIKKQVEKDIVSTDFETLSKLIKVYNKPEEFNETARLAVRTIMNGTGALGAAKPPFNRLATEYHRMTLLHNTAQALYAELLELHAKDYRPLPGVLIEMLDYVCCHIKGEVVEPWRKEITVDSKYQRFVDLLFTAEEVLNAPPAQISFKARARAPMFTQRLLYNMTPKSIVFTMTMKYAAIMSVAILIALGLDVERPYWVALSVHTVLLGNTTTSSLQRAGGRIIGTLAGIVIVLLIMHYNPPILVILLIIAIFGGLNEVLIASNYAIAMISITVQVLMLSSIAVGHLSPDFAYLRITDTLIGVVITLIGIFVLGRASASSRLPQLLGELTRIEAVAFHYLFSNHVYTKKDKHQVPLTDMYLMLFNVRETYNTAYGEISKYRKKTLYFYPAIIMLEQMSFILTRVFEEREGETLDHETMGRYLLAFEEVAKHFEYELGSGVIPLPLIPRHKHIRDVLDELQQIKLYD